MNNTTTTKADWQTNFAKWKALASAVRERAQALDASMQQRGWDFAATVGIPHCGCSLHNASIDDDLQGWCKDNPERLRVAKRANYMVNQWQASRIADRVIKAAWNRLMVPCGAAKY